jgi:hypothetical protein
MASPNKISSTDDFSFVFIAWAKAPSRPNALAAAILPTLLLWPASRQLDFQVAVNVLIETGMFQITIENRDYHQLSHFEIAGEKRIYQHLSGYWL